MANITYLLGAGASCGIRTPREDRKQDDLDKLRNVALPLVYEIPKRINKIINILKTAQGGFGAEIDLTELIKGYQKYYKLSFTKDTNNPVLFYDVELTELCKEFERFFNEVENHASIDTLAKKYYFFGDKSPHPHFTYERIKQLIDLFFILEHFIREFDLRYDLFIATILKQKKDGSIYLPSNIKILSWNYDFYLEFALSKFYQIDYLDQCHNRFNSLFADGFGDSGMFKLFKLNGSIGGFYCNGKDYSDKIDFRIFRNCNNEEVELMPMHPPRNKNIVNFIEWILRKNFLYKHKKIFAPINFAWEQHLIDFIVEPPSHLLDALDRTNILVIIGYSFPTFNRETDKGILKALKNVSKIYIQVPSIDTFDEIRTKIVSLSEFIDPDLIHYIKSGNEFFVPFEFN